LPTKSPNTPLAVQKPAQTPVQASCCWRAVSFSWFLKAVAKGPCVAAGRLGGQSQPQTKHGETARRKAVWPGPDSGTGKPCKGQSAQTTRLGNDGWQTSGCAATLPGMELAGAPLFEVGDGQNAGNARSWPASALAMISLNVTQVGPVLDRCVAQPGAGHRWQVTCLFSPRPAWRLSPPPPRRRFCRWSPPRSEVTSRSLARPASNTGRMP